MPSTTIHVSSGESALSMPSRWNAQPNQCTRTMIRAKIWNIRRLAVVMSRLERTLIPSTNPPRYLPIRTARSSWNIRMQPYNAPRAPNRYAQVARGIRVSLSRRKSVSRYCFANCFGSDMIPDGILTASFLRHMYTSARKIMSTSKSSKNSESDVPDAANDILRGMLTM